MSMKIAKDSLIYLQKVTLLLDRANVYPHSLAISVVFLRFWFGSIVLLLYLNPVHSQIFHLYHAPSSLAGIKNVLLKSEFSKPVPLFLGTNSVENCTAATTRNTLSLFCQFFFGAGIEQSFSLTLSHPDFFSIESRFSTNSR